VFVILISPMVLAGCNSSVSSSGNQTSISKQTVFNFYDKVQMAQTKEQVDSELGVVPTESTQLKNVFNYTDEETSFGVSVLFNENGTVMSKTLLYSNRKDIAFLTNKAVTQEQADKIKNGANYEEVKTILGAEGTEINATQIPFEDNKESYIRVWVNDDESMVQVVFGTDGTVNSVMFFE
jgi:hypothetical protein